MLDNILVQLIFLFCSVYVTTSAFVVMQADFIFVGIYLIGMIGSIVLFAGVILSAIDFKHDNDDGNGERKKIYPDDKDYSEKVLELYK